MRIAGGGGRMAAGGGLFAGGGGLFAGGPFATGLIAGGPFASGLNAATPEISLRLRSPTAPTNYYQSSNWYSSSAVMLQRVLQRCGIALSMLYACYTFQLQRNVLIKQR